MDGIRILRSVGSLRGRLTRDERHPKHPDLGGKSHRKLQNRIIAAFVLALCALIVIDAMALLVSLRLAESVNVVNRSHRAKAMIHSTLADLVSAESELRGFVITSDERFLDIYHRSTAEVESDLKELDSLVYDPINRKNLAEFVELTRARMARLESTLDTKRIGGFEAVREAAGPGKALMDELRVVSSQIEDRQNQLLSERDEKVRALALRTGGVICFGSLSAIALVFLSTVLLKKQMSQREILEREVLEISEREQRRIGQDLHDGVCQQLTGVSLMSRSLQERARGPLAADAAEITRLINESIEQARRVTRGLHPVPDEPMGLMVALKEMVDRVAIAGKVSCRLACDQPVPIPDRVAATHLYRITQEAVQNALRHASPKTIEIALSRDDHFINLTVTDDGCGLPSERKGHGLGLEIMDYRARSIGARFGMHHGEKGGTVVTCALPLDSLNPLM